MKGDLRVKRVMAGLLCLVMVFSLFQGLGLLQTGAYAAGNDGKPTQSVIQREADGDTTDTYSQFLLGGKDGANGTGSRYAGRIWSDKTVVAYNTNTGEASIDLDQETDGVAEPTSVSTNEDFLHVFSVLGSSQVVNEYPPQPLDVMFVLDVSGSMGATGKTTEGKTTYADSGTFSGSAIYKTVQAINKAIETLVKENPESRFGIVIYGSTAAVLVPLGHYAKGSLDAEFIENYGGNQGVHYKLTATVREKDKETDTFYYADNAGETNSEAHAPDTADTNTTVKGTGGHTTGTGENASNPFHVGHITNPQAGLAAAMDQFIIYAERTWQTQTTKQTYVRLPALIHLTDGQASDLAWIQPTATRDGKEWERTVSNWNNVNWKYDLAYNSKITNPEAKNNNYNGAQLTGSGDAAPVIFQTLMTAAYYKSAVEAFYRASGAKDKSGKDATLTCYSIYASDTTAYDQLTDFQIKATIDAILGPEQHFQDADPSTATDSGDLDGNASVKQYIDTAYELYKLWQRGGVSQEFSKNTTSSNYYSKHPDHGGDITITLDTKNDPQDGGAYSSKDWARGIDADTIAKNINYVPAGNFKTTGFTELSSVFDEVIRLLLGQAFVPVSGDNDAGVKDAVTYMDPMGEYMEVKSIDKLLLFGNMYDVTQTAVYDYQWNDAYMKQQGQTGAAFTAGWYSGATGDVGELHMTQQAGDVYRVDLSTAQQFVPTLKEADYITLTEKQKHTVYTFYRLSGMVGGENMDKDTTRRLWRMNPAYADTANVEFDDTYVLTNQPDTDTIPAPGAYRLSDIRMWVEDTGNWEDDTGMAANTDYSQALWLNIPANAVPVQMAAVTLGEGGKVTAYGTNLGGDNENGHNPQAEGSTDSQLWQLKKTQDQLYKESTPLRVFYSVGVEDSILYPSGSIDLTKVDPTYIANHTVGNAVYFRSNHWSGTQGDPVVSFSPGTANRYYVLQKPLPLYQNPAGDSGGQVEYTVGKDTTPKLDGEELQYVEDQNGFQPERSYYIVLDYYVPNEDGGGRLVQRAVSRRGSDLSSYLCWLNLKDDSTQEYKVGGPVPTAGPDDHWVLAAAKGGLRIGNISDATAEKLPADQGGNVTNTAEYYIYPTIGKTDAGNIVVNDYLGNNGWLRLEDTLLLVTKTVEPGGTQLVDPNEQFHFQLFLEGATRDETRSAIVVQRDQYTGLWRRRVSSINVMTGNSGYAQSYDDPTKFAILRGYDIGDGPKDYVVYLGELDTVATNTVRVYSASDDKDEAKPVGGYTTYVPEGMLGLAQQEHPGENFKEEDPGHPAGTREFWCEAYLYDISQGGFSTDPSAGRPSNLDNFEEVQLPIATMTLDEDEGLRSGIEITSDFAISWQYLTQDITFGVDALYDDQGFQSARIEPGTTDTRTEYTTEQLKAGTAQFDLKDGEGLLFDGLKVNADYRVTEQLTPEQDSRGYTLQGAKLVMNQNVRKYSLSGTPIPDSEWPTNPPESRDPGYAKLEGDYIFTNNLTDGGISEPQLTGNTQATLDNAAYFDPETRTYSIFKDTSAAESAVHFINTFKPQALTIEKELVAGEGATLTDEDWQKEFTFTADFGFADPAGGPGNGVTWIFPVTRYYRNGSTYPETGTITHVPEADSMAYPYGEPSFEGQMTPEESQTIDYASLFEGLAPGEEPPFDVEAAFDVMRTEDGGIMLLANEVPPVVTGYMRIKGPAGENGRYTAEFGTVTVEEGVSSISDWKSAFTLLGGEKLVIYGLPKSGYSVTVREQTPPSGFTAINQEEPRNIPKDTADESLKTIVFTNRKQPALPAYASLNVTKTFTDPTGSAGGETITGDFTFRLTRDPDNPASDPVKVYAETYAVGGDTIEAHLTLSLPDHASGTVSLLTNAAYTEPGVYNYTLREDFSSASGITYDTKTYNIQVTVTGPIEPPDGGRPYLQATITGGDSGGYDKGSNTYTANFSFANTYEKGTVSVQLGGLKTLTGREMAPDDFTFVLAPAGGRYSEGYGDGNPAPPDATASPEEMPSGDTPTGDDPNAGGPGIVDDPTVDDTTEPGDTQTPGDTQEPGPGSEETTGGSTEPQPVPGGGDGPEIFDPASVGAETAALSGGDETMPAAVEPGTESDMPQADAPQIDQPQIDEPQVDEPQIDEPQIDQPQTDVPQDGPTTDPAEPPVTEETPVPTEDPSIPTDTPVPVEPTDPVYTPDPGATADPGIQGDPGQMEDPGLEPSASPDASASPEPSATPPAVMAMNIEDEPMPIDAGPWTATATNDADGRFYFGPIKFNTPGTYYYQITEQRVQGSTVNYDDAVYFAEVVISENEDTGKLQAAVRYFTGTPDAPVYLENALPSFTNIETRPVKTEPTPGEDVPVKVGDFITYRVTWYNDGDANMADHVVYVQDRLDPGLTYVPGTAHAYKGDAPDGQFICDGVLTTAADGSNTLNWEIRSTVPGEHGYVEFQAQVNDKAKQDWDYNESDRGDPAPDQPNNHDYAPQGPADVTPGVADDWLVHNKAGVHVDTKLWKWTEEIDNPTGPEKDSYLPSESNVEVGDTITYRITWKNYLKEPAHITVTDNLDRGVTYIEGSAKAYIGVYPDTSRDIAAAGIRYNPASHTLTCDLGEQPGHTVGYVEFQVIVNENARYDDDNTIVNSGSVKVGNDSFQTNEVVHYLSGQLTVRKIVSGTTDETRDFNFTVTLTPPETPVDGMTEEQQKALEDWNTWIANECPGSGTREDGTVIPPTFTQNENGTVTVGFTLRHGQSYTISGLPVGAGYAVTETDADQDGYTTSYDERRVGTVEADHPPVTVVTNTKGSETPPPEETPWNPPPSGTPTPTPDGTPSPTPEGTPSPTPEGTPSPTPEGTPGPSGSPGPSATPGTPTTSEPYLTPTPTGMPHKMENDPGDGKTVYPGQWITYTITWENYKDAAATVTVRDTLDGNVEFVSASGAYTYDPYTRTVTWVLPGCAARSKGSVTLTVKVLESAMQAGIVKNQARVQVDNDSEQYTEIPKNPLPSNSPKTGDGTRPGLWLATLTAALTGLAALCGAVRRRRRRR